MTSYTYIGQPLAFKKTNGVTPISAIQELQNYLESEQKESFEAPKTETQSYLLYFILIITLLIIILWNVTKIRRELGDIFAE